MDFDLCLGHAANFKYHRKRCILYPRPAIDIHRPVWRCTDHNYSRATGGRRVCAQVRSRRLPPPLTVSYPISFVLFTGADARQSPTRILSGRLSHLRPLPGGVLLAGQGGTTSVADGV